MILKHLAHSSGDFCGSPHRQASIVNFRMKVEKKQETDNKAIEITFNVPCGGVHIPRAYFLCALSILLSCPPDRDWDHDEDMTGWGLG